MPDTKIPCFDKITLPDFSGLKKQFDDLYKKGMSDSEQRAIGKKIALDAHKDLFNKLNELKEKVGIKLSKQDKTYVIPDNSEKIKSIKDKYDKLIEDKKKEIQSQAKESEPEKEKPKPEEPKVEEKKPPPPKPPKQEPKKEEPEGENKVGVSQRHLTDLAKRLGLKEPERGEYIEPQEYAERGRKLLKGGATLDDVDNANNELHDRISIARAHLEDLTEEADKIGKKEGIKSDEYKEAAKKVEDYYLDKVKKLGTLAHRAFVSLQGERDLNTGSFTAVKKAFEGSKGSKATDEQTKKIQELTKEVETLRQQAKEADEKVIAATEKDINGEKETETKPKGKFEKQFKDIADKFRKLKAKEFKFKDKNGNEVGFDKMGFSYNDMIELGAKAIEKTGEIADGVAAIIEKIKDSAYYKGLSDGEKKDFKDQLTAHYEGQKNSANKLSDLHDMFADKKSTDQKFTTDEAKALWDYAKEEYLNKGISYRDMISYVSNDTGLTFDQVFNAITSPKTKRIADDVWMKQRNLRRAETKTKDFVDRANKSTFTKIIEAPDQIMRGTAVYGHGGIFVGTHAGMTLTDLPRAKYTVKAFENGYKFAYGNDAAYERSMQKLQDRPNYIPAQRAGLQNNPNETKTDAYQKAQKVLGKLGGFFKKMSESGVKGFNAIKVLRQDLFDDHFNRLTAAEKADPETARQIAELVNNATGGTNLDLKLRDKQGNVIVDPDKIMFAANMEAARWEKLTKNPVKATGIALKALFSDKATPAEKVFAKVWASRVGWELATYASLIAANAYIQSKTNPKNPVNWTDPTKPDYLKYKVGNTDINMTSGMLGAIDFAATLAHNSLMSKKQRKGDNILQADAKSAFSYGRGKLSPFAATLVDLKTGTDYGNNTLPFNSDKPGTGKHQLTWSEYGWEKAPIPVADAAKKMYESMLDNGMTKAKADDYLKGLLAFTEAGTTGFRISDSYQKPTKFTDEDKADPVLKYWIDKVGNLPEVSDANIPLHDTKNKILTNVAAMPKEKIEQFDAEHKAELKSELSKVKKQGYVYKNDYGNVLNQYPENEPTYPLHKVYLYNLSKEDGAKVLSNAQSNATKGAKKKIFNEN